jgi:endonuclease YncB( thermonuclease family)
MSSVRSMGSFVLSFLILILLSPPAYPSTTVVEGLVVKVADGDTITVLDSNRQQHRIRLAGVDAPEKGQPFGKASRKSLSAMLAGKQVRVEFQKYDRYGRIVGKVLVRPSDCPTCGKTLDVGLVQVTIGMAWWYRYYAHEQSAEDQQRYEFAEQEAKAKRVGLWQDKDPQPPWEYRAVLRGNR